MRIGLISDTHVPVAPLFPEVLEALRGVNLILHAGDIVLSRVLDELETIAPVYAAQGNHDGHLTEDPRVKPVHFIEVEGFRIALLHVFEPLTASKEWLSDMLGGSWADIVVHGDSHLEEVEMAYGALCINAGSATLPRNRAPRPGHIGYLTLERGQRPECEIIDLIDGERRAYGIGELAAPAGQHAGLAG